MSGSDSFGCGLLGLTLVLAGGITSVVITLHAIASNTDRIAAALEDDCGDEPDEPEQP